MEKTISIPLAKDDLTNIVQIGGLLDEETKARQTHFLRSNADVFAWSTFELEIPTEVITHQLKVVPDHKHVYQKKRTSCQKDRI